MHEMTNKADRNGRVVYLIETCPGPDIFVDGSIGIDCELRLWCHSFCCNSTVCERGLRYPAELYGRNPEITKTTFKFTGYKYSLSVVHKLHPYGDLLTCTLPVQKIRQNTTLINSPKSSENICLISKFAVAKYFSLHHSTQPRRSKWVKIKGNARGFQVSLLCTWLLTDKLFDFSHFFSPFVSQTC